MAEWQPIETAPKDGTQILVFGAPYGSCYNHNEQRWTNGYLGAHEVGQSYWTASFWQTGRGVIYKDATHWMPLPPPPAQEPSNG